MTDFWVPWGGRFPRIFIDANGRPIAGATLSAYKARTTTPANMYDGIDGDTIGSSVKTSSGDDAGYIERDENTLTSADTLISVSADAPILDTGIVYATWDPGDLSGLTISNEGRTVTRTGGNNSSAYANALFPHSAGKWYWEMVGAGPITDGFSQRCGIRFAPGNTSDNKATYNNRGTKKCNIGDEPFELTGWGAGDVLQFALDLDAKKIWFGENGTFSGDPAAGTGPACSGGFSSARIHTAAFADETSITLRTDPADMSFSPPSGFTAGWY